jgi:ATP-dependent DNA helicase RecQ
MDETLRAKAESVLRGALGETATFRHGQLEAIAHVVDGGPPLLLVQRTGWGKSAVYFIASRLIREQGRGIALVLSPLLALTRNQIAAARAFGLTARAINSETPSADVHETCEMLAAGNVDVLFVTPERLSKRQFHNEIVPLFAANVGLVIVDEAHCISDWGHDFRPDYRRIGRFLGNLRRVPVIATTATANDRVVRDIQEQLNTEAISRGPLVRESLRLQTVRLPATADRLAWLADVLPTLSGTGIVYVLTKRDANIVARWLRTRNISCKEYYSGIDEREEIEEAFLANQFRVLVATSALGMGFDKPDIGFVIHYQRPSSVIAYYQQVGRAGRAIDEAFGILIEGDDDDDIAEYFIKTALPLQQDVNAVLEALRNAADGLTKEQILSQTNIAEKRLNHIFRYLDALPASPVQEERTPAPVRYYRTAVPFVYDAEGVTALAELRRTEQQRMREFMAADGCLMLFVARELDDPLLAGPCGQCAPCRGEALVPERPQADTVAAAEDFLNSRAIAIEPRKQWPPRLTLSTGAHGRIPRDLQAQVGIAAAFYGVGTIGRLIKDRQLDGEPFGPDVLDACARAIEGSGVDCSWATVVPSRSRPHLAAFARELADRCNLEWFDAVAKNRTTEPQKIMQNSYRQVRNIDGAFDVTVRAGMRDRPGLLIDDVVDSRWTFTLLTYLLRREGCGPIIPFAIGTVGGDD